MLIANPLQGKAITQAHRKTDTTDAGNAPQLVCSGISAGNLDAGCGN
jgi:hypothetical protein